VTLAVIPPGAATPGQGPHTTPGPAGPRRPVSRPSDVRYRNPCSIACRCSVCAAIGYLLWRAHKLLAGLTARDDWVTLRGSRPVHSSSYGTRLQTTILTVLSTTQRPRVMSLSGKGVNVRQSINQSISKTLIKTLTKRKVYKVTVI